MHDLLRLKAKSFKCKMLRIPDSVPNGLFPVVVITLLPTSLQLIRRIAIGIRDGGLF